MKPTKPKHTITPQNKNSERGDRRVHVVLPVRIIYWDKDKAPSLEMACTYDISRRGARISRLRCVKQTGEIIAVERGRNKAYCRVVWVGEPNSAFGGQIGVQCVESDRPMFEVELQEMADSFEPVFPISGGHATPADAAKNRRKQERVALMGTAELLKPGRTQEKVKVKNLSEKGCLVTTRQVVLPGTELRLILKVANYTLTAKGKARHSALDLGLGIEFTELGKNDQEMLKRLLQKIEEENLEEVLVIDTEG